MNFEEQADAWIAWARSPRDSYWFFRHTFFELLPPAARTIEIGCGEGRVTRDLRTRGYDVVALDASPKLVEAARAVDPSGDYAVAAAESLPFRDGLFELAVAYNALMDVDEMHVAVGELGRVLTANGVLCACVTHPLADSGRWVDADTFVISEPYLQRRRYEGTFRRFGVEFTFRGWIYPVEAYSRALEDAGFVVEALREPPAPDELVADRQSAARWQRLPNFLMFRARKLPA